MKLRKIILMLLSLVIVGYIAITQKETVPDKTNEIEIEQNSIVGEKNHSLNTNTNSSTVSDGFVDPKEQDEETLILRKMGETCGASIGQCEQGLKCAYPCGIQGCENVCLFESEPARP